MHNPDDFKVLTKHKNVKHYHLFCDQCGADRGYHQRSRSTLLCKACKHAGKCYFDHNSPEFKKKMSVAKKGQIPWSKGKEMSAEFCENVSRGRLANSKNPKAREHRALRQRMSNLLNSKFYKRDVEKVVGTFRHLPYAVEQLKVHLESRFYPNPITGEVMTWENHSINGWHIDHKIPDSWFTYLSIDDQEFKDSWALSNLQPKWAYENLSKSNRFVG